MLSEAESRESMVNAFSEIQVLLRFHICENLCSISFGIRWPVKIHSLQQRSERRPECSASLRHIVKPGEEIAGCDMMIKCCIQP
jgi:hypothetical protein